MGFFYIVPQSQCLILESFGKFSGVLHAGFHVKYPWQKIKRVEEWGDTANKNHLYIELTEQQSDTSPRSYFTKDNIKVDVDAVVRWRIIDPRKAVYEINDDMPSQFLETVLSGLRAKIGSMNLDEVNSNRSEISNDITGRLRETCKSWGLMVASVEIKELNVESGTEKMMLQQADAERQGRSLKIVTEAQAKAKILTALAEKRVKIIEAEGEKISLSLIAEGESIYLKNLIDQVGPEMASKILMAAKAVSGYKAISANPADKVIIHDGSGPNILLNEAWSHK